MRIDRVTVWNTVYRRIILPDGGFEYQRWDEYRLIWCAVPDRAWKRKAEIDAACNQHGGGK